jgi:hypothetical protein
VFVDERIGVTLQPGLGPPALVMPARLLLEAVEQLVELAGPQTVEMTLLAADDADDCALPAPDERDERGEVELPVDLDLVPDGLGQGQDPPDVVQAGAEERQPLGAVPLELLRDVRADPLEVGAQALSLHMVQLATVRAVGPGALVEQRVQPRLQVPSHRGRARVEAEVDADGAPLLGLERGEIA